MVKFYKTKLNILLYNKSFLIKIVQSINLKMRLIIKTIIKFVANMKKDYMQLQYKYELKTNKRDNL